jgi:hypothetical protein
MSGEVERVIARSLAGVGEGIAALRAAGEPVTVVACSIEVDLDGSGPAARMTVDLGPSPQGASDRSTG